VWLVRDGLNVSFESFLSVPRLRCFQDLKCDNYQLAVQALAAESKLHKLYNETRHKGKNEMDFEVQPTDPTVIATSSGAPVSLADDIEVSCSSDKSISSEESDDRKFRDFEIEPTVEKAADDSDSNWEDDEIMFGIQDLGSEDERTSDSGEEFLGEGEDCNINVEAYESGVDRNGIHKTEQAGVIHLVHRWTQRGHPDEVSCLFVL
jgi:hypothetical protein